MKGDSSPNFLPENARLSWRVVLSCFVLSGAIFLFDLAVPLGVAPSMLYIIVIFISFWSPGRKFTIQCGVLTSTLTILGFHFSPPGGELWKVIFNRVLSVVVIWVTGYLTIQIKLSEDSRRQAIQEREQALEEINVLRGILPICASCKKIRDDKGSWQQIEVYIRNHSEAEFSHGICPDCIKKLYPEFSDKLNQDK